MGDWLAVGGQGTGEAQPPPEEMRHGNDVVAQYRSALFAYTEAQPRAARAPIQAYQSALTAAGHGAITTEVREAPPFYFAEDYHQQYLAKNPRGYCSLGGTGVGCPSGLSV